LPTELTILPWPEVAALASAPDTLVCATARAHHALAPEWPAARWLVRDPDTVQDLDAVRDPSTVRAIIAIGGGSLIDDIKRQRAARFPAADLIAVPTIWGSGAEASPVAVWTEGAQKHFQLSAALRPTAAAFDPRFAATLSPSRARDACGDVWSHALEAFLSPLATDDLRTRLATLIRHLTTLPVAPDARWFEPGALAASLQARSSVGLVHGLAHVLEPALARPDVGQVTPGSAGQPCPDVGWVTPGSAGQPCPDVGWVTPGSAGHARLCALLIGPVLRWNAATSGKWVELGEAYGIERARVEEIVEGLGEVEARRALVPVIEERWRMVLRDPCTRTNSALVRPDSLKGLIAEVGR
jgi:alcohol dehydrogenase class IV